MCRKIKTAFYDIDRYLYPLEKNPDKEKKDLENLMELRNNVCGGMALINILWVAINFMFQYKKPTVIDIPLSVSTYIYILYVVSKESLSFFKTAFQYFVIKKNFLSLPWHCPRLKVKSV